MNTVTIIEFNEEASSAILSAGNLHFRKAYHTLKSLAKKTDDEKDDETKKEMQAILKSVSKDVKSKAESHSRAKRDAREFGMIICVPLAIMFAFIAFCTLLEVACSE